MNENNGWQEMMSQLLGQQQRPNNFNALAPRYEITRVSGRAGAENFRMAPNSSYLLLDNTAPIIWFVRTDGSGLLTATPCDYSIHQDPPPIDVNALLDRIQNLEERLNEQSNSGNVKQQQRRNKQSTEGTVQKSDTTI